MAEKKDRFDGEYVGNIFGWKLSLVGAVVILLFTVLIVYRHHSLDVPYGIEDPLKQESEKAKFAPESKAERDTVRLEE